MIGKALGHYQVSSQLGKGGMGEVYVADDLNLNRKVALKFLPDAFAGDPERMARFEREARLLASLNHPNIAAIYGLEQAEGKRFIVMELVEGETLAQRIGKGALPVEDALAICRQIAEGLEAAHEKGVIHRDLKPANVMITEGDRVKILDFGLAKALSDEAQTVDSSQSPTVTEAMTRPGVILGTAAYMSPEQAKGKSVDKRADIWAFGCILYECLTGRRPFEGETVTETLAAILKNEPNWQALPATTPPGLRAVLRRCLEREMNRRFHDAADVRIEIQEASDPRQELEPVLPAAKSRGVLLWVLATAGLLALGGIAAWILKPSSPSAAQVPARLEISLPPGDQLVTEEFPPIALSPDGRHLAYIASRNSVQQIFIRSLDTYEASPLAGTEGAAYPFFSPDSAWIGFFSSGKLKKIRIAGGATVDLCDSGSVGGATWGDDGTIVFSPSRISTLWRVSANGGKPQPITILDLGKEEISHKWPQFLPGSKALLFTVSTGLGWDHNAIAVLNLGTGEKRILVPGAYSGSFAPTGHLICYRAGALLALPFDPASLRVSGAPKKIAEGIAESAFAPGGEYSISATGSLAYVPAGFRQFERRLVWVDSKGRVELLSGAPVRSYWSGSPNMGLSISADGRQVAVQIDSGTREIWTYDITRNIPTPLAAGGRGNMFPLWTPDGTRVAYTVMRAGLQNIYWRNADGTGEEERLTSGDGQHYASSWSPDGKWLAFEDLSPASGTDIWMLRLDGERKQQRFLGTPFAEYDAQFSPDGRWLAYRSNETRRFEVYVCPFPGPGRKLQISTEGGEAPRWSLAILGGSRYSLTDSSQNSLIFSWTIQF